MTRPDGSYVIDVRLQLRTDDAFNRVVCVGVGYSVPKDVGDVAYHVYQILM